MLILPFTPSVPVYEMAVPIGDASYVFGVRWNARAGAWFFDLSETDGTPIALGVRVTLGVYMARRVTHPLLLNGVIVARDRSGRKTDPGLDDLGTRVQVLYATNEDVTATVISMRQGIAQGDAR